MKGYFKQLAHQTGLSFESGQRSAMSSPRTQPTSAAPQTSSRAKISPLHVEEVTYVAQPPTTARAIPDRVDKDAAPKGSTVNKHSEVKTFTEASETHRPQSSPEPLPHTTIEIGPQTFSAEAPLPDTGHQSSLADSAEKEIRASVPEAAEVFDESFSSAQAAGPQEFSEGREIFQTTFAETSQQSSEPSDVQTESSLKQQKSEQLPLHETEAEPGSALEQTETSTVQHYLKEVMEWISAPPEIDESELEQTHRTKLPRVPESENSFALEHERDAAAVARQTQAREPEVQDLNLSIGTISIVIEEPKAATTPALPAPAPRAESSHAPARNESSSLSRYYLRSF
jgi:hypothetical protein